MTWLFGEHNTFKCHLFSEVMDNYMQLIDKIGKLAGMPVEEIDRKVEAKRAKLSGLVSKEGAAQIVAAELGINFDKERMKISELVQGMKRANAVGKILKVSPIRSFNKNGREGKVCNFTLADESGNVKTVLWDTNHIALFESGTIKEGDIIEISNGNVRNGELHLSSFSDIKQSKEKIGDVMSERVFSSKKLKEAKPGQSMKTRAVIIQVFDPRYFEVCPECGKKVVEEECKVHGKVQPRRRALLNIVIDDGTEALRSVLFGEQIYTLGLTEEDVFSLEKFSEKKNSLLGEEKIFSGNVKSNALYNTTEFNIEKVDDVNVESLLAELQKA